MSNEDKCQFYEECYSAGMYDDCDYDHWNICPCPNIKEAFERDKEKYKHRPFLGGGDFTNY